MTVIKSSLFALVLWTLPWVGPALSHEFWIEPEKFQVETGEPVVAQIKNGEQFKGINLAYFERRIARFDWSYGGDRTDVRARAGDVPALHMEAPDDGLLVLSYQSMPSTLTYGDWEKFTDFVAHKGFPQALEQHAARGLPDTKFKEVYTRYCKALVGVGTAQGQDIRTGMDTEIVAGANPYTDTLGGKFPITVFYMGKPRAMAQVEVFEMDSEGQVDVFVLQTDSSGQVVVPVKPGRRYLLDAVVLRQPDPETAEQYDAVWETLWASLTFAVPQ